MSRMDIYRHHQIDADADGERGLVGSLSRVTGKTMQMDDLLPDWLEEGVESSLRDSESDVAAVVVPSAVVPEKAETRPGSRAEATDLDSFYADPEELSEEESEDDGSEDEDPDSESGNESDV